MARKSPTNGSDLTAPRVIRITPDGRLIVDPMSIIGSDSAKRHLEDIANKVPRKETPRKPAPA